MDGERGKEGRGTVCETEHTAEVSLGAFGGDVGSDLLDHGLVVADAFEVRDAAVAAGQGIENRLLLSDVSLRCSKKLSLVNQATESTYSAKREVLDRGG
jgi:hypothetical protein